MLVSVHVDHWAAVGLGNHGHGRERLGNRGKLKPIYPKKYFFLHMEDFNKSWREYIYLFYLLTST